MELRRDRGALLLEARDMADFIEHVNTSRRRGESSSAPRSSGFHVTSTFEEASTLMLDGWREGPRAEIEVLRGKVRERLGALDFSEFRFDHSYSGQYLCVSSFLAGEAACLLRPMEHLERRQERFVRVVVDVGFSALVPARDIQTRGGAVVGLCDALNVAGFSTEVWAVSHLRSSSDTKRTLGIMVPIQRHGQPWDIDSASFPLANGDYLRRLIFGAMEGLEESERQVFGVGSGYGRPMPTTKGDSVDRAVGGADIIVDNSEGNIASITRDPIGWIMSRLENVGALEEVN